MIYDTIDYCKTFQEEGILIILDFFKAFDRIEWPFIEYILNLFNFGENFINYIKLCQRNSKSREWPSTIIYSTFTRLSPRGPCFTICIRSMR